MLDIPSTEAIVAVLEAGRCGSMSAAAAQLGLTHGAISRRVQAVEHWLGTPVFERVGRGVRLTPQGLLFTRRAERSLLSIEALRAELSTRRTAEAIRVSMLPSFARLWFMPRLARLEAAIGGVPIDVITEHRVARLDARDADIAIRFGSGAWPEIEAALLFSDLVVPAAAPALAARLGSTPAELMTQSLIVDGDGADWRQWCRAAGITFRPLTSQRRFLDHDLAVEAARQGLGVVLLRLPFAASALDSGSLERLDFPTYVADRAHYIATRAGESRRAIRALVEIIRAEAAADPLGAFDNP